MAKDNHRKLAELWNKSRSPIWTCWANPASAAATRPAHRNGQRDDGSKSQDGKSGQQPIFVGPQFPLCDAHCQKKQGASCFLHLHRCNKRNPQPFETSISASARFVLFGCAFLVLDSWSLVLGGVSHSHCRASLSGTRGSAPDPDGQRGKDTRHSDRQISSADTQSSRHAARVLPPPVSCFFYFSNRRNLEFATQQRRV